MGERGNAARFGVHDIVWAVSMLFLGLVGSKSGRLGDGTTYHYHGRVDDARAVEWK